LYCDKKEKKVTKKEKTQATMIVLSSLTAAWLRFLFSTYYI